MQEREHEAKGHPPAAEPAVHDPIEAIMAAGELPAKAGKPAARDLSAEAMAAAMAERREPVAGVAGASQTPVVTAVAARPNREWLWRGLLAINVAVLAAVVALPSRTAVPAAPAADSAHGAKPSERRLGFAITEQQFYLRSLELAADGKFDDAIAVLEGHLKANPDLAEVEQRLTYHALAMFAVRAGRSDDASRYEAAMDRLRVGAQLPQDLLDLARQAEAEKRGADMRRYYARFLLQQKQVPPSLRARIAEAYLKLGDSYRVEAEQGAEREAATKRAAAGEAMPPPSTGGNRGGRK